MCKLQCFIYFLRFFNKILKLNGFHYMIVGAGIMWKVNEACHNFYSTPFSDIVICIHLSNRERRLNHMLVELIYFNLNFTEIFHVFFNFQSEKSFKRFLNLRILSLKIRFFLPAPFIGNNWIETSKVHSKQCSLELRFLSPSKATWLKNSLQNGITLTMMIFNKIL